MKKLKKLTAFLLIFILCFSITACGNDSGDSSESADDQVYELAATWVAAENSSIIQSWYKFKDKIEEESGGRIKVTTYHTGQIAGSDRECAEKVATGICQFATVPMATVTEFSGIQEYSVSTIPYIFKNDEELDYIFDQGVYDDLNKQFLEKTGLRPIGSFSAGWVTIGMNKGEVSTPADVKGKKIRAMASDGQMLTLEAWGGAPTPMAYGEMFTGLQQHTIDGALAAAALFDTEGFGAVLESVTDINPFSTYHLGFVNQEWYESLPEDLQKVFDDCIPYFFEEVRAAMAQEALVAFDDLESVGCKVIRLTDEQRQAFIDSAASVTDKMAETIGPDFVEKVRECLAEI